MYYILSHTQIWIMYSVSLGAKFRCTFSLLHKTIARVLTVYFLLRSLCSFTNYGTSNPFGFGSQVSTVHPSSSFLSPIWASPSSVSPEHQWDIYISCCFIVAVTNSRRQHWTQSRAPILREIYLNTLSHLDDFKCKIPDLTTTRAEVVSRGNGLWCV